VIDGSLHRQFCETPPIDRETMRDFRRHNHIFIKSHLSKLSKLMTYEEWRYRKRHSYTDAQLLLLDKARVRWDNATSAEQIKFRRSNVFVKDEYYGEVKHCRLIVNRTLEWLSFMGPIMTTLEDEVYKLPQFAKHLTETERIRIVSDVAVPYVEILEGDYTSYESCFVKQVVQNCEWLLVSHCILHLISKREENLLREDMMGVSVFRHRHFQVRAVGRRKSGDAHTSLANGFTNFMLYRFAMLSQGHPIPVAENVKVEGDDSAGAAPWINKAAFEAVLTRLGFRIKMKVHRDPERITFCQTQHVANGDVVRDPRPILAKFGWSKEKHVQFNLKHRAMLLRAKAMSLAATLPGCPVVWALAASAIRLTDGVTMDWDFVFRHQTSWERENTSYAPAARAPSWEARIRVEEDFGINIVAQQVLEDYLLRLTSLSPMWHPLFVDILPPAWAVFSDVMSNGPVSCERDPRLVQLIAG
jgi:hypothetical protein